jgi:uncharacterized membrane protein (UPF0127 family)
MRLAVTPLARLRGQLGRSAPVPMLIAPCSAVHTCFLRFPLDLVFLDADLNVLKVVRGVPPWRFVACRGAKAVLELPTS